MDLSIKSKVNWILEQHRKTNHLYDGYLPYEIHQRMTAQAYIDHQGFLLTKFFDEDPRGMKVDRTNEVMTLCCFGHDLIEDARVSYNDCVNKLCVGNTLRYEVADIIYALTNLRGKSRNERANDEYYNLIVKTPGAAFVKMCDRIANVKYSVMTGGSKMLDRYKQEDAAFKKRIAPGLGHSEQAILFSTLSNLLHGQTV